MLPNNVERIRTAMTRKRAEAKWPNPKSHIAQLRGVLIIATRPTAGIRVIRPRTAQLSGVICLAATVFFLLFFFFVRSFFPTARRVARPPSKSAFRFGKTAAQNRNVELREAATGGGGGSGASFRGSHATVFSARETCMEDLVCTARKLGRKVH